MYYVTQIFALYPNYNTYNVHHKIENLFKSNSVKTNLHSNMENGFIFLMFYFLNLYPKLMVGLHMHGFNGTVAPETFLAPLKWLLHM